MEFLTTFAEWMFKPGSYNDFIVVLSIFVLVGAVCGFAKHNSVGVK